MQGRFYLPMYGRFASPDPARDQHFEETQSWNIYSYCHNSPTMRVDPDGMDDFYFNVNGHMVDRVSSKGTGIYVEATSGAAHGGRNFQSVDLGFFRSYVPAVMGEVNGNAFEPATDVGNAILNAIDHYDRNMDSNWYGGSLADLDRIDAIERPPSSFTQAEAAVQTDNGIEGLRTGKSAETFRGAMSALSPMSPDTANGGTHWVSNKKVYDPQMKKLEKGEKLGKGYSAARQERNGKLIKTKRDSQHTFHKDPPKPKKKEESK